MLRILSLVIAISILAFSCKTTYQNPMEYSGPVMGFGNSMSTNGQDVTYIILKNGQLFKRTALSNGESEMNGLGRIDKNEAKTIFNEAEANGIATMSYNRPAKKYYYIFYAGKGLKNRVVWSDDEPAPEALLNLYKQLNATLPAVK